MEVMSPILTREQSKMRTLLRADESYRPGISTNLHKATVENSRMRVRYGQAMKVNKTLVAAL